MNTEDANISMKKFIEQKKNLKSDIDEKDISEAKMCDNQAIIEIEIKNKSDITFTKSPIDVPSDDDEVVNTKISSKKM